MFIEQLNRNGDVAIVTFSDLDEIVTIDGDEASGLLVSLVESGDVKHLHVYSLDSFESEMMG